MQPEVWLIRRDCAKHKGIVVDDMLARGRYNCGGEHHDIGTSEYHYDQRYNVSWNLETLMTLVVLILVPSFYATSSISK